VNILFCSQSQRLTVSMLEKFCDTTEYKDVIQILFESYDCRT
jgi:hypothetical protein